MSLRLSKAYRKLKNDSLDGLIISSAANISYLTESISRDSYLLISRKGNFYFTDSRYTEEAKNSLDSCFRGNDKHANITLKKTGASVFQDICKVCLGLKLKRVGFDSRHLPFAEYHRIKEHAASRFELIPVFGLIETLRQVKDRQELVKLRQAAKIAKAALEFAPKIISKGVREIEVVGELERFIRYNGGASSSFDIIVASGPNTSQPHYLTGRRKIMDNDMVLIDLGVDYQGYKSDLTRVFFLGKIKNIVHKVYGIVQQAQRLAIEMVKPGVEIGKIDSRARSFIAESGYAKNFEHNLGHGFGLEIHEEPNISSNNRSALMPGMVFTVEPGIYLPGRFGIRLEEMVLVTQNGYEVF